ncbi:hypothetical protein F2P79_012719 [Pimephales promelas]|nr:hypothetical protein F2P79_012719 [Pimephales promelas]
MALKADGLLFNNSFHSVSQMPIIDLPMVSWQRCPSLYAILGGVISPPESWPLRLMEPFSPENGGIVRNCGSWPE